MSITLVPTVVEPTTNISAIGYIYILFFIPGRKHFCATTVLRILVLSMRAFLRTFLFFSFHFHHDGLWKIGRGSRKGNLFEEQGPMIGYYELGNKEITGLPVYCYIAESIKKTGGNHCLREKASWQCGEVDFRIRIINNASFTTVSVAIIWGGGIF